MKVSVLLTSYKHEKYLRQCVDSALGQTLEDREIIVVDDNSPDSSPEILKSYGDRIRLQVNAENRGTYGVLNQALEMAKGEYCAVLNSDDLWLPRKLELQAALMDANPEMTFCHTYGDFIDENGNIVTGRPMGFDFPRTPTGNVLPIFIANNTAIASSVMFRTSMAREIGGFDTTYKNLGDWDMWLRLAERGTVGFVDEKLTLYRIHGMNTIYNIVTTRSEEMRLREDLYGRRAQLKGDDEKAIRGALSHTTACLGSLYSITGNSRKARELYIESLKLNPTRFKSVLRYLVSFAPLSLRKRLM